MTAANGRNGLAVVVEVDATGHTFTLSSARWAFFVAHLVRCWRAALRSITSPELYLVDEARLGRALTRRERWGWRLWNATRVRIRVSSWALKDGWAPPRRFGPSYRAWATDEWVYVLRPFHLPVRLWDRLGGRWMLHRALYRLGALQVEENHEFSTGRLRWPWCSKLSRDYAVAAARMRGAAGQRRFFEARRWDDYAQGYDDGRGAFGRLIVSSIREWGEP